MYIHILSPENLMWNSPENLFPRKPSLLVQLTHKKTHIGPSALCQSGEDLFSLICCHVFTSF